MKTLLRFGLLAAFLVVAIGLTGCAPQPNVVNIPAGYAGMILTPTGWTGKWLEAGQVDLGVKNENGTYNSLVLLQVTSTTVKEQFLAKGEVDAAGKTVDRDDRVLTQDAVPLSLDAYIRSMVPADPGARTAILAQVAPVHFDGDPAEVQRITIEMIYGQFAKPETRGMIRSVLANYANYAAVYQDYANIPEVLGQRIDAIFKKNGVPLTLMSVSLSNVKPDETVWSALNKKAAAQAEADAIAIVGKAYRDNPEYSQYQQWQSLMEMAKSDPNLLVVVNGSGNQSSDAMVEALLQQMMKKTAQPTPALAPAATATP